MMHQLQAWRLIQLESSLLLEALIIQQRFGTSQRDTAHITFDIALEWLILLPLPKLTNLSMQLLVVMIK